MGRSGCAPSKRECLERDYRHRRGLPRRLCQFARQWLPLRRRTLDPAQYPHPRPGQYSAVFQGSLHLLGRSRQGDVQAAVAGDLCAQLRLGRLRSLRLPPGQPGAARGDRLPGDVVGALVRRWGRMGAWGGFALCRAPGVQRTGQLYQQPQRESGRLVLPGGSSSVYPRDAAGGRALALRILGRAGRGSVEQGDRGHPAGSGAAVGFSARGTTQRRRVAHALCALAPGLLADRCRLRGGDRRQSLSDPLARQSGAGDGPAVVDPGRGAGVLPQVAGVATRAQCRTPILRPAERRAGATAGRSAAGGSGTGTGLGLSSALGLAAISQPLGAAGASANAGDAAQCPGQRKAALYSLRGLLPVAGLGAAHAPTATPCRPLGCGPGLDLVASPRLRPAYFRAQPGLANGFLAVDRCGGQGAEDAAQPPLPRQRAQGRGLCQCR